MKFAMLVTFVAEELEEKVRSAAKEAGAGGVTILTGRGSGSEEKKSFFGLTYEGTQTVLLYVLEKRLALRVLKAIKKTIETHEKSDGIAFYLPIEHLTGIDARDIQKFEQEIIDDI